VNDRDSSTTWHALTVPEVLTRLETSTDGLTEAEAGRRLARIGPNVFRAIPARPAWRILIDQFRSVVVLLLLAA
jgi:Ca2+-transporting ATPase